MRLFRRRDRNESKGEPEPEDPARLADLSVLTQLQRRGVDLSQPRRIEHFIYVPSEQDARSVVNQLADLGYEAGADVAADGVSGWVVRANHTIAPLPAEISRVRQQLTAIADTCSGEYDGWGTPV